MSLFPTIPRFGFGTEFQFGLEGTEKDFTVLLLRALELGVRLIDCDPAYGTQALVGRAIKMAEPAIKRSELFITSKLPIEMTTSRTENIRKSLEKTLDTLQVSYLDLLLIDAGAATSAVDAENFNPTTTPATISGAGGSKGLAPFWMQSAWRELISLKREGLFKYIGLYDVNLKQLQKLAVGHHTMDVLANEMHLYHQDKKMRHYCKIHEKPHYMAYSALGSPEYADAEGKTPSLNSAVVDRIARERNMTDAQVVIQWLNQEPLSYVIRSDNIDQLEENVEALGPTVLSIPELEELDSLDRKERLFPILSS